MMEGAEKLSRGNEAIQRLAKIKAHTIFRLKDKGARDIMVTHGCELPDEGCSWWAFLAGTGILKVKVATAKAEKGAPWLFPSSFRWSWSLGKAD